MKRFLVIAICLFGLGLPFASSVCNPQFGFSQPKTYNDGWESLGSFTYHFRTPDMDYVLKAKSSVDLYVKAIGYNVYYQVRIGTYKYTVSTGVWEYSCHSCRNTTHIFDGKFSHDEYECFMVLP